MTPEEIFKKHFRIFLSNEHWANAIAAMKEYGDQEREIKEQALLLAYDTGFINGRDKALDWATKNAFCKQFTEGCTISVPSIQNGKTSKDLQP